MATGFYVPDGRDFSSIFTAGNAGFTSGFKQADGQDLGNLFQAGNLNLVTGYKISNNIDMGNKLGATVAWSNNANTCQVLNKEGGTEVTNTHIKNVGLGIYDNYSSKSGGFFLKFHRAITLTYAEVVFSTGLDSVFVQARPSNKALIQFIDSLTWTGSIQNCTGIYVRFWGMKSCGNDSDYVYTATLNQLIVSGHY